MPSPGDRLLAFRAVIGFIVAGLVIGALARLLLPGKQGIGFWRTLLVGLLGSVIGGVVANAIGTGDVFELNVVGFVVAVLAAIALLVVGLRLGLLQKRDGRRREAH